jgi:hypothetical protein
MYFVCSRKKGQSHSGLRIIQLQPTFAKGTAPSGKDGSAIIAWLGGKIDLPKTLRESVRAQWRAHTNSSFSHIAQENQEKSE